MTRKFSRADSLVHRFDAALRTLVPGAAPASRASPASREVRDSPMDAEERRHAAGLVRIHHAGALGAQALYQGQGLTAGLSERRGREEEAARDEAGQHLAWCDARLDELNDRTSRLTPFIYIASFGLGAAAGVAGHRVSLGMAAATEEQLGKLLDQHLERLPRGDQRSRAVLCQMRIDEAHHVQLALEAGAVRFPGAVKAGMSLMTNAMACSVYRL
ncbi:2-polyprenyl-3-methyl-6-methoxy-1,4-benzoquinone monooxygenase [Halomonas sp. TRM85114]|uniref:2-polyprenyl-3-methyl-6-methoxy-1,4-benzoquinone monooxygenase n=1 Tax=Halomonas jincaotanensis TaxID=2810616 RepID=UPI001BD43673|nr:2-polyprenyl-3-methyl-6-methoxy-1,4-benzoquinone monooxygenase [Halomonas jincaotanensis]MBS9404714.1 2-polyprenyl-3-methyl-6-methoxy-1,4-benzoquinone monooxygenase [Halomonas jincaotanensis]